MMRLRWFDGRFEFMITFLQLIIVMSHVSYYYVKTSQNSKITINRHPANEHVAVISSSISHTYIRRSWSSNMPKLGERGEEKLQKYLLHVSHRRRPTTSECVCYQHEAQERTAKPCRARFTGIEESFFFDILFDSIVFRSLSRSPTTHSRRNSFFFCGDMERKKN